MNQLSFRAKETIREAVDSKTHTGLKRTVPFHALWDALTDALTADASAVWGTGRSPYFTPEQRRLIWQQFRIEKRSISEIAHLLDRTPREVIDHLIDLGLLNPEEVRYGGPDGSNIGKVAEPTGEKAATAESRNALELREASDRLRRMIDLGDDDVEEGGSEKGSPPQNGRLLPGNKRARKAGGKRKGRG